MNLWSIVEAYVHAAETTFIDPQTGPIKQKWVHDQVIALLSQLPMGWLFKLALPKAIDMLIEVAVAAMKRDIAAATTVATPAA